MKTQHLLILAALVAVASADSAYAAWSGDTSQDYNDLLNWDGDVFPAGNVEIFTDAPGVFPIVSADAAFTPVDIFIAAGGNPGRLDHTAGRLSTGDGNWMFVGIQGNNGVYNLADTSGAGGAFTGFAQGSGDLFVGGVPGGELHVALDDASSATVNVNTSGSLNAFGINTGNNGGAVTPSTSTFNLDAGTINTLGAFRIGSDFFSPATGQNDFNMSGGVINSGGETWIGGNGLSNSQMTGGEINSAGWFVVGRNIPTTNSVFDVTGGVINAGTGFGWLVVGGFDGATGTMNASGGEINALIEGVWIGEGATGTANLSGTVDVNGGWLRIGGNNGSVGEVNVAGSTVTVDVNELYIGLDGGGVDTDAMGTLNFSADTAGVSTIVVAGDVNLSSPDGDFLGVDLSGYAGPHVDMLLVDGVTSQGEFTGLAQGAIVPTGGPSTHVIDYSVAGDVWLRAIPEPSTVALLCLGGLLGVCRRMKN